MKRGILVAAAGFGAVLAVVVGLRLEAGSLALLVGVVCGLVAGLPVSAALLYALTRERAARARLEERRWEAERPAAAPPVFILNAGREVGLQPQVPLLGKGPARDFVIVGEEEHRTDAPAYGRSRAEELLAPLVGEAKGRSTR